MVAWQDIDTVLLDMDGTLLDLHFDNYFWREYLPVKWGELHACGPEQAKQNLMPRFERNIGTLSWYCVDYWSTELQIDVMALKNDIVHLIQMRPYTEEFLDFLRRSGKQVVMVTNCHEKLINLKMEKTRIDRYFHEIFCAHSLGAPKEESDFWVKLRQEFNFVPEKTILIDDNLTVLRTARQYGIRHLLTIAEPDSQSGARDTGEFTAIHSFQHLIR
ncbi:MAG: haloacid dehalogenase [Gammaproteobacteria bacterium RIFCSPLOWO2_12_FULL_52_10]|nr:MAG: haloacid dehalogenase [Gammaproteobacteria bacterium RIFCSPLOWO2_12_FULL_52_10]